MFSHQQSLLESLKEEQEPAMALHLVTVLLFQRYTNCIIQVPGKLIPSVITFLSGHMPAQEHSKLVQYQMLVMQQLRLAGNRTAVGQGATSRASEEEGGVEGEKKEEEEGGTEGESQAPAGDCSAASVEQDLQEALPGLKQLVKKPAKASNE